MLLFGEIAESKQTFYIYYGGIKQWQVFVNSAEKE